MAPRRLYMRSTATAWTRDLRKQQNAEARAQKQPVSLASGVRAAFFEEKAALEKSLGDPALSYGQRIRNEARLQIVNDRISTERWDRYAEPTTN